MKELVVLSQVTTMSMVVPPNFQHIMHVLNTNIEGKTNVMFALTSIKGIGRRYANIVLKKADIPPMPKRAGELGEEHVKKIITTMQVCIYFPTLNSSVMFCFRISVRTRSHTGPLIARKTTRTARPTR